MNERNAVESEGGEDGVGRTRETLSHETPVVVDGLMNVNGR